jgi:hypothetical protein
MAGTLNSAAAFYRPRRLRLECPGACWRQPLRGRPGVEIAQICDKSAIPIELHRKRCPVVLSVKAIHPNSGFARHRLHREGAYSMQSGESLRDDKVGPYISPSGG